MIGWKKHYNKGVKKNFKKTYLTNIVSDQTVFICSYLKMYLKNYFKSSLNDNFYVKKDKGVLNKLLQNYLKPVLNAIFVLKNIKNLFYQSCCYFLSKTQFKKQNFLVFYIIYFNFSISNTHLQIIDSFGNSKVFYSAGLVNLKGKQKIVRKLVLVKLLNLLTLLKLKLIKNAPIALHLKNVGSNKFLLVKKLKRKFFIKIIKTFELNAYNGCRKKKEKRKR